MLHLRGLHRCRAMTEAQPMDSYELARLCTIDCGREVASEDVRSYLLVGARALGRFTSEERHEIEHTILKELSRETDQMRAERLIREQADA